jgi:predicted HAD superfamily phosphohydrolase YqeG
LENSVHRRREVNSIPISLAFIEQVKLHNSIIFLSNSELHRVSKCAHYIMMGFSEHANKPTRAHKRWNFFMIQVFWDVTH